MSLSLFAVTLGASTGHERPALWPHESGYLKVFLFGQSVEDALNRTKEIVRQLPFVLTAEPAHVAAFDEPGPPRLSIVKEDGDQGAADTWRVMEANARLTGFAFAFIPVNCAKPRIGISTMIRAVLHMPEESA
jgi:hypothetical protein